MIKVSKNEVMSPICHKIKTFGYILVFGMQLTDPTFRQGT